MATFDSARPIVAAMATGAGRAALDFLKKELVEKWIRDAKIKDIYEGTQ